MGTVNSWKPADGYRMSGALANAGPKFLPEILAIVVIREHNAAEAARRLRDLRAGASR